MATRDDSHYVLMHDAIMEHPKVEPLSDAAFRLLWNHITWCHRQHTDGFITKTRWQKTGTPRARGELFTVFPGQKNPLAYDQGDRVELHDYLDWQQSAAQISAAQQKSSAGGAFGNHRRWHESRGVVVEDCKFCQGTEQSESGTRSVPRLGEAIA